MCSYSLFKRYVSFFLKFSVCSLILVGTALGLGNVFFPYDQSVFSDVCEEERVLTVVIDAGHGGRDGGAVAEDGTLEKHLNLEVAMKLKALLESSDIRVVMTRETDIELASPDSSHKKADDLKARVQLAQECENAIFVSIHMNRFPVEKYSGLQVYYSENHENSIVLAQIVQNVAEEALRNTHGRKVKSAGDSIYIMAHLEIPAVLVECGFLSNFEETALLKTENYQKKLAMCLYASLIQYFSENA